MKTENQKRIKALLLERLHKLIPFVKKERITQLDAGSAMLYLKNRATKEESEILDEIWKELPKGESSKAVFIVDNNIIISNLTKSIN